MFTGDPRRANLMSPILRLKIAMYGGKVSRFWNQIGLSLKSGSFGNQLHQLPALNHYSTSAHPLFHPLLEQSVSSRLYQPSQRCKLTASYLGPLTYTWYKYLSQDFTDSVVGKTSGNPPGTEKCIIYKSV